MTLSFGIIYSYTDFFLPLVQQFGWTHALASVIPSVSLISFSIGSVIGGLVISRVGFRRLCFMGSLMLGTGTLLSGQIHDFTELLTLFGVVVSLGNAFVVIAATSLMVKWFVKKRGLAVGVMAAGSGVGTLIVPPVAELIIALRDWRTSFLLLGISFLILLLIASFFMQTPEDLSIQPYGLDAAVDRHGNILVAFSARQAFATVRFWTMYLMFFLGTFGATIFIVHAAPLAASYGINGIVAAEAVGILGAGSVSARIAMGVSSEYMDRSRSVVVAFGIELSGLLFLAFYGNSVPVFFLSAFAIGFGYGGFLSDFIALAGDLFGMKSMERVWGLLETAYGLGGLLGPILAGIYFDVYGNYFGILVVAIGFLGSAFVISFGFSFKLKQVAIRNVS